MTWMGRGRPCREKASRKQEGPAGSSCKVPSEGDMDVLGCAAGIVSCLGNKVIKNPSRKVGTEALLECVPRENGDKRPGFHGLSL